MGPLVIDQRRRDIGGFEVGRVLPSPRQRMVGPFVFLDHMGPARFEAGIPRSIDVRPHPHIGLATVTYLFDGEIMHRDSVGSEQAIRPGEVNWMVAGRGITHSERFERARAEGGTLHGMQAWVALPSELEECAPAFVHHALDDLPALDDDGGARGRLIAGAAHGLAAGVATASPLFYLHWQLPAGARIALPSGYGERAAYVASGTVEVDGQRVGAGQMAVCAAGAPACVRAVDAAVVMALGGETLGPRHLDWNFVSSSKERIEQAKADWRAGRMKLPDLDDQEFIPLPAAAETPPAPLA